jgi:hypothetical protein
MSDRPGTSFQLAVDSAHLRVEAHGPKLAGVVLDAAGLVGGVSSSVVVMRGEGVAVVLEQVLAPDAR